MSEHMSDPVGDNDPVIERAARALGAPERFGDDFEESLLAAIRADRPPRRGVARRPRPLTPAWWSAPGSMTMSPLMALAMAAGIAAIAVLGTLTVSRRAPVSASIAERSSHDTVTFVRFVFVGPAKRVSL